MLQTYPSQNVFHCLLFTLLGLPLAAQQFNTKNQEWRDLEEQRATGLFNQQHDFSPIDDAFALREADQLYAYYALAQNRQFGYPRWNTPEEVQKTQYTPEQRQALNLEVQQRAQERLRQLSGLPRYLGDRVESLATVQGKDNERGAAIDCLFVIGDDESIVELGRFLFDDRNPDVTGPVPPLTLGVPMTIKYQAVGCLEGVLRRRQGIGAEVKTPDFNSDWFKTVQNWWLKSAEAAPYRRKLADSGVVLPPGYPPMAELKGAKTTIAPTTTPTPVPKTTRPSMLPETSEAKADEAPKSSVSTSWPLIMLLLALLLPVWLVMRKRRD